MSWLFLILSAVVLILISFALKLPFKKFSSKSSASSKDSVRSRGFESRRGVRCPICRSFLLSGERLKSIAYSGKEAVKSCAIVGCPHCYPRSDFGVRRKCPVCKCDVPQEGFLVANILKTSAQKHELKIYGCSQCKKNTAFFGNFPSRADAASFLHF